MEWKMQWTECKSCGNKVSIGSYLFQIKKKKFPDEPAERVCVLCGNATVDLHESYEAMINQKPEQLP
jgi:hypothetical protein